MKLKVLGTGTSIPELQRLSSSYLLQEEGHKVLIDIGPAVVRRLLETGFTVNDIDTIVVTHFHVDHVADLATFLFAANYGLAARVAPLTIVGGAGIHRFVGRLCKIYPWIEPNAYELTVLSLAADELTERGPFRLKTVRVKHNRESIAARFETSHSITFTGDTDYSRNLVRLAKGTDLLVTECSFPERKVKGHLNLETLEKIVTAAMPKRVLVSHQYPEWDHFRGILYRPYILASDGMEIEVS